MALDSDLHRGGLHLTEFAEVWTAKVNLHPRLQAALNALHDYTSDDHGIRHALKDDAEPEAEDARSLLVTCSAIVNFLVEKASKNGLLPK
jgi:hypothetical protein